MKDWAAVRGYLLLRGGMPLKECQTTFDGWLEGCADTKSSTSHFQKTVVIIAKSILI